MAEASASLRHRFDSGRTSAATLLYREYKSDSQYAYPNVVEAGATTAAYTGATRYSRDEWLGLDAHMSGPVTLFGHRNDVLLGANDWSSR